MKSYILALDQGSTSSRAVLFNLKGEIIRIAQQPIRQIAPNLGWVEYDPMEIWGTQLGIVREVLDSAGVSPDSIACIGIANQRETCVVWNRETGKPIYNAISWQCRRTVEMSDAIKRSELSKYVHENTGLIADAYFSGTKLKWILDNVPEAQAMAEEGLLAFGTIDTWLLWKLTHGECHFTDCSNASRTMLFNISTMTWDETILEALKIPRSLLPEVLNSNDLFGKTHESMFGGAKIPISAMAGDQQAALFGQGANRIGDAKVTYENGCFLLMNIGSQMMLSSHGLLTTIAWRLNGKVTYALEGSVFMGGAVLRWLQDDLKLLSDMRDSAYFGGLVKDTGGVYFVPAFTGLGAPHWDMDARGVMLGMTRGTNKNHIIRAGIEAIAYQVADVFDAMKEDSAIEMETLKTDGQFAENDLLMQIQSDVLGIPVERDEFSEMTAFGIARMAGLSIGVWQDSISNRKIIHPNPVRGRMFFPVVEESVREYNRAMWKKAVERAKRWAV